MSEFDTFDTPKIKFLKDHINELQKKISLLEDSLLYRNCLITPEYKYTFHDWWDKTGYNFGSEKCKDAFEAARELK